MAAQPPFKPSSDYNTALSPLAELMFRGWVKDNNVPFNPDVAGPSDYDMRGYWQGAQNGNPMARPTEINPNDNRPHYTDYYKTPLHKSFSSGSQWADSTAPQWINDSQLAAPGGRIVLDEREPSALQVLLSGQRR